MSQIQTWNERVGISGVAEVIADRGGLPAVWVEGKRNGGATGTVYLHGAHVAAWRPGLSGMGGDEVLFLSNKSAWGGGKPMRGGVSLCFPWFGPRANDPAVAAGRPASPMHGFARLMEWELESIAQGAGGVTVTLGLKSNEATRAAWPHDFLLRHRVTFGRELVMALEMTNTGKTPLTFEEAQ